MKVADICRSHSISLGTFYKWRSHLGDINASMIKKVKALREENTKLKKMYADSQINQMILKEALSKKRRSQAALGKSRIKEWQTMASQNAVRARF